MISKLSLANILFLDIETVPLQERFEQLEEIDQQLYADKTKYQRKEEFTPAEFYDRAGIWAEFGKIICISVGYFVHRDGQQFRTRSFVGEEKVLLEEFANLLNEHFSGRNHLMCAHNGKEFDFPYIARRMVILGIEIPSKLNLFGKKPWEVPHLDTLELWKFGDYKHYTSLKLLTRILGIPSPKDDIDGSQVRDVYYQEHDIKRIATYCEKDVVAVAQIILKLRKESILTDEQIISK
ncbi:3'-5' exonuclease [Nonlabens sp. Ci31]|jgi:uncharacterized protein YprB with RNaseH-like and TPR domain|uniref:3'-5' exonuclease n=1 Tax=Nonlabens sp. Ci31 TaxID=2608253 RepID=UPI001462FCAA|nr:3'-5' exonuclease [Nonlabens sp. Ci31]QJP33927.1 3'-5' exonuclease [Nonlabens sp. Ci31]